MAEFAVAAVTVGSWQLTVGLLWQLDCEFELAWSKDVVPQKSKPGHKPPRL